jgi:hypothetical protein
VVVVYCVAKTYTDPGAGHTLIEDILEINGEVEIDGNLDLIGDFDFTLGGDIFPSSDNNRRLGDSDKR